MEIKDKFKKISQLIPDDSKNLIARYIAGKLVCKRRTYLTSLTMEQVKMSISNFKKLEMLFDTSHTHCLRANIDLKIIEAYILCLDIKEMKAC